MVWEFRESGMGIGGTTVNCGRRDTNQNGEETEENGKGWGVLHLI